MKKMTKETWYAAFLIVLAGFSIIPLVVICQYNHPCADDFSYSAATFREWNCSHSLKELLLTAIDVSKNFYRTWQGLYSSAFFLALQPSVFGEEYYFLTGIIMLCLIVFSTCFFFSYIVKKVFRGTVLDGIAVGSMALLLTIQWMPSCVQGLYWYNGAVNYGLFHAIFLLLVCACMDLHYVANGKVAVRLLVLCGLGWLLEGGNHVTALMGIILLAGFTVLEIVLKKKVKSIQYGGIALFMVICFTVNITSPGTRVRSEALAWHERDFFTAIVNAISGGIQKINSWMDLAPIIVVLLIMPIILKLVKRVCENTDFKFEFPFLVFVCSVAWICLMYCPSLYVMGSLGAGRLQNIVYYHFVILLFINVFYCTGWIVRRAGNYKYGLHVNVKWVFCTVVLLIGLAAAKGDSSWSYKALKEWKNGSLQKYSQQAYERYEIFLNSAGQDVIVREFSVKPETLFFDDITDNPDDWRNSAIRNFYGLNSVVIGE